MFIEMIPSVELLSSGDDICTDTARHSHLGYFLFSKQVSEAMKEDNKITCTIYWYKKEPPLSEYFFPVSNVIHILSQ